MPLHPTERAFATRVKLRQLLLVAALDERRSLRKAAADLAMTQPAATKLLRDLEEAVGLPLFSRHAWGMVPTAYGATLARHARGLVAELGEARRELAAQGEGAQGSVRIGGVTGAVPGLLAPAIRTMQAERPGVALFVLVNATEVLLAALREGKLDAAVCPLPADVDTDDLVVRPLGHEPLRIVARAGHPLARRRRVTVDDLARLPWIVQTPESPLRRDVDAMLAAAGRRLPRSRVETVSVVAALALLEDSDAVTAMPKALADHYARHGIVVPLAADVAAPASRYELVTRARRELAPAAQAFVAMLETVPARAAVRRSRR